ncbi:MAG: hypothetical protein GVY30_01890, partial [Chloroflexi bacterium]|nr:hypothetical protein [Chloroflexota bacterium]
MPRESAKADFVGVAATSVAGPLFRQRCNGHPVQARQTAYHDRRTALFLCRRLPQALRRRVRPRADGVHIDTEKF